MSEAPKPKKERDETRQRSLDLLKFWYQCRCADGAQRYHPDGSELTMTVPTSNGERRERVQRPTTA